MSILSAYGPQALVTSPAVRCRETIAPYAQSIGVTPEAEAAVSQLAYDNGEPMDEVVHRLLDARESVVVCTHSPVVPELVAAIATLTGTRLGQLSRQSMLSTGECAVLHLCTADPRHGVVAAETHGPLS